MGADLFESYVGSGVAAIAIGATMGLGMDGMAMRWMMLPMLFIIVGMLASVIGIGMFNMLKNMKPSSALSNGLYIAGFLFIIAAYFVVKGVTAGMSPEIPSSLESRPLGPYLAVLLGIVAGMLIALSRNITQPGDRSTRSLKLLNRASHYDHQRLRHGTSRALPHSGLLYCHGDLGFIRHLRSLRYCHCWCRHAGHSWNDHVRGQQRSDFR
jgi:Na+/H+-translocating membrane pyrophosphatase